MCIRDRCYPKRPQHEHYARLVKQLEVLGVPFAPHEELLQQPLSQAYDVAVSVAIDLGADKLVSYLSPGDMPRNESGERMKYMPLSVAEDYIMDVARRGLELSPGQSSGQLSSADADSADDAAAWVSALVRERYFNVRDERDAYRDLQHDLSAQAAASRDLLDEATEANDEAERRHVAAARAEAELDDRLRSIARELDEDDDDSEGDECLEADVRSSILARMKRRGRRSMARIAALEAKLESKEASSEERARELRRHGAEVAQLEEELRREEARTQDEAEPSARLDEETDELRREAQEAALESRPASGRRRAGADESPSRVDLQLDAPPPGSNDLLTRPRRFRPSLSASEVRASSSSQVSRAAPSAALSPSSMNPAGTVHCPRQGSMARRHSSTRPAESRTMHPTTTFGFS